MGTVLAVSKNRPWILKNRYETAVVYKQPMTVILRKIPVAIKLPWETRISREIMVSNKANRKTRATRKIIKSKVMFLEMKIMARLYAGKISVLMPALVPERISFSAPAQKLKAMPHPEG